MPNQAPFGRRTDGPTGRRRAVRERMPLAVSLFAVDQSRVALLADISESGCRLQGMGLPEIGQDVLLRAVDVELFGRIVWKYDRERGVQFHEPIGPTSLDELRRALGQEGQKTLAVQTLFRPKAAEENDRALCTFPQLVR